MFKNIGVLLYVSKSELKGIIGKPYDIVYINKHVNKFLTPLACSKHILKHIKKVL